MRSAVIGFALLVFVSACGGGDEGAREPAPTTGAPVPALPACAGKLAAGPSTPELPVHFPLPPGTALVSSASPFPTQFVVQGLVPGDLGSAASFFNDTLPEHGYQVGIGDSEGNESEAPFTGNGYRGKWRVNAIPDCDALRLTIVLIEQA
jgi:hypothetical protein